MISSVSPLSLEQLQQENARLLALVGQIGRKNWLFHGNDIGAKAGAVLFSLIETCKQNHMDPFSWFKYALTHIKQASTVKLLEKLLPYNMDTSLLEDMRTLPNLTFPQKCGAN